MSERLQARGQGSGRHEPQSVLGCTHLELLALLLPLLDDVLVSAICQAFHHTFLAVHAWVDEQNRGRNKHDTYLRGRRMCLLDSFGWKVQSSSSRLVLCRQHGERNLPGLAATHFSFTLYPSFFSAA